MTSQKYYMIQVLLFHLFQLHLYMIAILFLYYFLLITAIGN
jgi:hypothetical protein